MSFHSFIKLFLATFFAFLNIEIAFSADFTITKNSEERLDTMFPRTTKYAITKLKVIGEINTDDLLFIKEMATSGNLSHLDLSSSTIVDVNGIEDYFQNVKVGDQDWNQNLRKLKPVWSHSYEMSFIGYYIVYGNPINANYDLTYKTINHVGINSIPYHMFDGCVRLVSVSLPSNTTLIGDYAFANCKNLQFITLPDSIEEIGISAFSGCTKLSNVKLPSSRLKKIGAYAFSNCNSIYSITIPNTITSLERSIFSGCKGLRSVKLPDNLEVIPWGMFEGCRALYMANIPLSCIKIGTYAFQECSLDTIVIPQCVNNIGLDAFAGNKLSKVYSLADIPPYLENDTWPESVLYVPKGCSEVYSLSPGWKRFGRIIELPSNFQQSEELPELTNTYITMSPNNGFDFNQGKDYVVLFAPDEVIDKMGDKILSNQNLDLKDGDHSIQSIISNKQSIVNVERTNTLNPYGGQTMLSFTPIASKNYLYFNSASSSYDLSMIDEDYIIHLDLSDFGGTEGKFTQVSDLE